MITPEQSQALDRIVLLAEEFDKRSLLHRDDEVIYGYNLKVLTLGDIKALRTVKAQIEAEEARLNNVEQELAILGDSWYKASVVAARGSLAKTIFEAKLVALREINYFLHGGFTK